MNEAEIRKQLAAELAVKMLTSSHSKHTVEDFTVLFREILRCLTEGANA